MTDDDNLEHECHTCNKRTRSTVQNRICCYPEVLCIVLCCSTFKDNASGRILSSVDFPVENFKPNEHFGIHERTDDTSYDLVASVNHHPRPSNGGHYTAICRQHESGMWYEYDDDQVNIANFSKMCHGIRTVKMHLQRAATILFYIVSKPPTSVDTSNLSKIDGNEGSINSNENSHQSRFSDVAGDNNNI